MREQRVLQLASVAVLLFTVAAQNGSGQLIDSGAVLGRVVDAAGDSAGMGHAVEISSDDGLLQRAAETTADGRFAFEGLPAGFYRLRLLSAAVDVLSRVGVVALGRGQRLDVTLELDQSAYNYRYEPMSRGAIPPPTTSRGRGTGGNLLPGPTELRTVYYATDRAAQGGRTGVYGGGRNPSGALFLGRIEVNIPREHRFGQMERPYMLDQHQAFSHYLVILARRQQSYDDFYSDIAQATRTDPKREVFVFIHGFNVDFEGAIYRTAQMAYDLQFAGPAISYTWPSMTQLFPTNYATENGNAEWTQRHLRWFLEDVVTKTGATYVHLIAHSMGNRALVGALASMGQRNAKRFGQIVLAAPDLDAGTFIDLAEAVHQKAQKTTLYASANDRALRASKRYQTYPRAGDTSDGVVVVGGIDTVDVSAVDTSLLGHSYYGDNASVISDLFLLLRDGLPPLQRPRIREVGSAPKQHFRFVP